LDGQSVVAIFIPDELAVIGDSAELFFFIDLEAAGAFVAAVLRVIFGLVVDVLFLSFVAVLLFTYGRTSSLSSGYVSSQHFQGKKGRNFLIISTYLKGRMSRGFNCSSRNALFEVVRSWPRTTPLGHGLRDKMSAVVSGGMHTKCCVSVRHLEDVIVVYIIALELVIQGIKHSPIAPYSMNI
jgi:hypothetical protein